MSYDPAQGVALVRIEGFETSVSYRSAELRQVLATFGNVNILSDIASRDMWQVLRRLGALVGQSGALWRVSVKPTDGPAVVTALHGAPYVMDWSGGLIWAVLPNDCDLRASLRQIAGHATCFGQGHSLLHPQSAGVATIMQGIREKFDPHHLFPSHSKAA